jgi:hypothetical protein
MANRGMSAALLDEIGKQVVVYYDCVEVTTIQNVAKDVVVYRFTDAPQTIVLNGNPYNSFGQFLDIGEIEENMQMTIPDLNINLSGIAPYESEAIGGTDVSGYNPPESIMQTLMKDTTVYIDQPVNRYRVYFDLGFNQLGSIKVFEGQINAIALNNDPEGSVTVSLNVSSHWVTFTRTNGRKTNTNSQQSISGFSGDTGFVHADKIMKDVVWQEPPQ